MLIKSYTEFEELLIKLIKMRSRNFVNTDCEIGSLIELVYNDINEHCVLGWEKYAIVVDDSIATGGHGWQPHRASCSRCRNRRQSESHCHLPL